MLHQATQAIERSLSLSRTISDWNVSSEQLADPPRKRTPPLASYFDELPNNITKRSMSVAIFRRTCDRAKELTSGWVSEAIVANLERLEAQDKRSGYGPVEIRACGDI